MTDTESLQSMDDKIWTSHEVLQPLCRRFLASLGGKPYFPGPMRSNESRSDFTDIVLFGDFVDQIVNFRSWPSEKFRLWVLSHAVKESCTQLLGIPSEKIGVIPREKLFQVHQNPSSFPDRYSEFTMFYSGRFVINKNFDLFLRVCSALQTKFGMEKMRVLAFGNYPNDSKNVAAHMDNFILRLPWTIPPEIFVNLGPFEWLGHVPKPCVSMNLSVHYREDFGVSVAQVREVGIPCILSDWGGHRDVGGKGVLKLPFAIIPENAHMTKPQDVSHLCEYIIDHWDNESTLHIPGTFIPEETLKSDLRVCESAVWAKFLKYGMDKVRASGDLPDFFITYSKIFGRKSQP